LQVTGTVFSFFFLGSIMMPLYAMSFCLCIQVMSQTFVIQHDAMKKRHRF
jgi:hypothetical protein